MGAVALALLILVVLFVLLFLFNAIKIVPEYQRLVPMALEELA